MKERIIPLYDCGLMDDYACLKVKTWMTAPYEGAERVDFVLPEEFCYKKVMLGGNFIVHRDSDKISRITAAWDGRPMVYTDTDEPFVLEYA